MAKVSKVKLLKFFSIASLVSGFFLVLIGYSFLAVNPIQANKIETTVNQVFPAPDYSDKSFSYDDRKFLPYSLDLRGTIYFEPLKQRHQDTTIKFLNLETRWGWVPISLDSSGFMHLGELSGVAFQSHGLEAGEHSLRIQIDPRMGILVSEGNKTVFSTSVGLDLLNASDAHSVMIFNNEEKTWMGVEGTLNYFPPSVQGKTIPRISIVGAIFIFVGLTLFLSQLLSKRFPPLTNPSAIRLVKSTSWTLVVLAFIFWSIHFLTGASMSFGKEQVKRSDWYDSVLVASGEPYSYTSAAYPPGSYGLFSIFSHFDQTLSLLFISTFSLGVLAAVTAALLRTSNTFIGFFPGLAITLFAFPTFFVFDRGNLDILLAAILVLSFVLLLRGRYVFGSILAGILTALKFFPGLYFIAAIKPIHSRKFIVSVSITILVFVILTLSYWLIGKVPMDRWVDSLIGSGGLSSLPVWVKQTNGLGFGAFVTEVFAVWNLLPLQDVELLKLDQFFSSATWSMIVFGAYSLIVIFVISSNKQPWKRVLLVILFGLVFSPVTFGYRALFLIAALILLNSDKIHISKSILIGGIIGTILSPIGEVPIYGLIGTISTLIKPFLIISLGLILLFPLSEFNNPLRTMKTIIGREPKSK